ncbi:MAG: hypothetical protein WC505_06120 [Patescibacteria group bacterium]
MTKTKNILTTLTLNTRIRTPIGPVYFRIPLFRLLFDLFKEKK